MQELNNLLSLIDAHFGGSQWFVFLLLGTGLFFTVYLRFPQLRFFGHAIKVVRGKYDNKQDIGDTSHFQALATALSGTVGTGNIAGVALASRWSFCLVLDVDDGVLGYDYQDGRGHPFP